MDYLNIKLNSYEYRKLSNEDKLRVVKTKLNDLFETKKGKMITVVYNGTSINIPYEKRFLFKDLCDREKALEKKVNILFEYEFRERKMKETFGIFLSKMSLNEEPKEKIDFDIPFVDESDEENNVDLSFLEQAIKERLNLEQKEEDFSSVWIDSFNKRKLTLKEEPYGVLNINDVFNNINNGKEEFVVPIVKNIGKDDKHNKKKAFFRGISNFPFIRKISDKYRNKNKVKNISEEENSKKRNIKVAVVALGLACTTMIGSFVPGMFKKKNNSNRGNIKSTSYVEDVTKESTIKDEVIYTNNNLNETESVVETNINVIETENIIETKETSNDIDKSNDIDEINENDSIKETEGNGNVNNYDNYTISFEDRVTINDNSYIYSSSYDAAGEKNGMTPLFDCSYERDIMGVVYNLDGNIYTIYSSDSHAYEKANELISKGAKEEAVLVTRSDLIYTGQYEGYYDIDDVNVKTLTKNR